MDDLKALGSLGFTLGSPAYLSGVLLFSILGWAAYRFGKKSPNTPVKWLGIALMLFPYVISETWPLYAIGTGLCVAMYLYWQ